MPAWWSKIPLWPVLLLGGLLFLTWAWLSHWWAPITAVDISQLRANTVLPAPNPTRQIRQEFVATKDGLQQVELLLSGQEDSPAGGRLVIQLLDDKGQPLADRTLDGGTLGDRHPFTLTFRPQDNSAGQRYTLLVSGTDGNGASVWGYTLDGHEAGQLTLFGGESEAKELRFVTRYQLSAGMALKALSGMIMDHGRTMLLALAMLLMPGGLLLQSGRFLPGHLDPLARLGAALALGASLWPVAWVWLTVIGGRWAAWSLWLVLIAGWATIVALFLVQRLRRRTSQVVAMRSARFSWHHGVLLLVLVFGLIGRLLAVRDLAFPPWVDSSRHALITTLMAGSGQAIRTYQPLLPVEDFPYHFGFHTLSAGLMIMDEQALPTLLLFLGQLLNGLIPLTTYAAAYLLTRRRSVGLLAAFMVALPFFFPAYYATWGRMTQVTAVMILPLALALTWLLIRGARIWRRAWPLVGLLAAGLFLIHFRVFVLFLPFAVLVWLVSRGRQGRWLALAGGLTLASVAPHLVRLIGYVRPTTFGSAIPGYNEFPVGYVTAGWERGFLALAALGVALVLLAALRRRRWTWLPILILCWVLIVAALLMTDRLGLPGTNLVNLNSSYIVAFLPLALILAITAGQLWRWLADRHGIFKPVMGLVAGAALMAALLFGLRQQITILNTTTILAWPEDVGGLSWLEENVPEETIVAVNSWRWLGNTWAGSDGGAWIVPLTGRQSTTPPADYAYSQALTRQVTRFNEEAQSHADWSDPAAARWLKEQGVSFIYVGAKGGDFDPAVLSLNPELRLLFGRDGVYIFEVL